MKTLQLTDGQGTMEVDDSPGDPGVKETHRKPALPHQVELDDDQDRENDYDQDPTSDDETENKSL
jgi:hypothetical protein